ncbi:DUF3563 family protein [Caballeronia sp. BR00000012568055]|nr:DUF3563 family protein [Caballeronia sp. BR00000012568055]
MIMWILERIGYWCDAIECQRRETYIADAKDLSDVERRIRWLERSDST